MRFTILIVFVFCMGHASGQLDQSRLKIAHLTGDYYIYSTYSVYEGNRIPAHGMYLVTESGVVIFDTPWDTTQFQPLLDSIRSRHGKEVVLCVATHWHGDRTAGLEYYRGKGIKTYTTLLTDDLSRKNGMKRAEYLIKGDTIFTVGKYSFKTYYPGPGHTEDNIVVWFEKEKILYGGCLIKGADAENLGYLGDANVTKYASTLRNVKRECPKPRYIIVSHHNWNSTKSLDHSIKLADKLERGQGG